MEIRLIALYFLVGLLSLCGARQKISSLKGFAAVLFALGMFYFWPVAMGFSIIFHVIDGDIFE